MQKLDFDTLPVTYVKRLGLIVLQTDVTIEDEFRYYFEGMNVNLMVNRIPFKNEVTVETLKQMQNHLTDSVSLFPLVAEFDCIGYGCTSGALHIGDEKIKELVVAARPCTEVTNPMRAAIDAIRHVEAKRIAYLSPYSEQVSQTMIDTFEKSGISVPVSATFDETRDEIVGRVSPSSIKQACIDLAHIQDIDVIFISCTNLKCAKIIPAIEEETGVIVISSNQALVWHINKLAEISANIQGKGILFEC